MNKSNLSESSDANVSSDALVALETLIKNGLDQVYLERWPTLCGPTSTVFCAANEVADGKYPDGASHFRVCLKTLDRFAADLQLPIDTWKRFRLLANLYSGSTISQVAENLKDLISLLDNSKPQVELPADDLECTFFEEARCWLASKSKGLVQDPGDWTAADWQLVGYVHDARTGVGKQRNSGNRRESTPIFLANERTGRVLRLVAERLPGPPGLVSPHWWKLGMTSLGRKQELLEAIHFGFHSVLGSPGGTGERFQVRWWLEMHPGDGAWHDEVGESDSVQVSAACLAMALRERGHLSDEDGTLPLLDTKAGVSATLVDKSQNRLPGEQVGAVDFLDWKMEAAERAGIKTFLRAKSCTFSDSPSEILVHPIVTLDDAYRGLLATTTRVRDYKVTTVAAWENKYVNTDTHQDFIDAARKSSNS